MYKISLRKLSFVMAAPAILIFIWAYFYFFEVIINTTKSMPIGLYKISKDQAINVDDIVIFDSDTRVEFSQTTTKNFLKKVAAKKGDIVLINDDGVFINGTKAKQSKPQQTSSSNMPLHHTSLNRKLGTGEFIVLGQDTKSFDSRYFGAIELKKNNIKKVQPLFILE